MLFFIIFVDFTKGNDMIWYSGHQHAIVNVACDFRNTEFLDHMHHDNRTHLDDLEDEATD